MNSQGLTIFLYTGYTPRAAALKERIIKASDGNTRIIQIDSEELILEKSTTIDKSVVILDLPNIKRSAIHTVEIVKDRTKTCKLLAIHIYTTKLLVNPLIQAGVDGYLTYEPSPKQIKEAISAVMAGELYIPVEILG